MHLGVALFATDLTSDVRDVARAAEDAGFEALFVAEHTHIPTSRATPYPMGGELPDEYSRTLDPFVALTAAAAVTKRLRLGTGVCLVVERDPIVLFKDSLKDAGVFADRDFDLIEQEAKDAVVRAVKFADESPVPDDAELLTDVFA